MAESKSASVSRLPKSAALAFLAASTLTACWMSQPRATTKGTSVLVAESDLNFGEAWETRAFDFRIRLRNVSQRPVLVKRFETSCSCLAINPESLAIAPDETAEVRVVLDLSSAFPSTAHALETASFRAEILALIDDVLPSDAPRWRLTGVVRRALTFSDNPVRIADRLVRGQHFPVRSIRLKAHQRLDMSDITVRCPPQFGSVRLRPSSLHHGNLEALLSLNPDLATGDFSFELAFETKIKSQSERVPITYRLPIVGHIEDTVQLLPSSVICGAEAVGAKASAFITAKGPGKVVIQAGTPSRPDITVTTTERPDVYQIHVWFTERGQREGVVRFNLFSEAENREVELPLKVVYYGL